MARTQAQRRKTSRSRARRSSSSVEDLMFFPKLRRKAKWVFLLLAIAFGVGFVAFGVGTGVGGTSIGDVLRDIFSSSSERPGPRFAQGGRREEPQGSERADRLRERSPGRRPDRHGGRRPPEVHDREPQGRGRASPARSPLGRAGHQGAERGSGRRGRRGAGHCRADSGSDGFALPPAGAGEQDRRGDLDRGEQPGDGREHPRAERLPRSGEGLPGPHAAHAGRSRTSFSSSGSHRRARTTSKPRSPPTGSSSRSPPTTRAPRS